MRDVKEEPASNTQINVIIQWEYQGITDLRMPRLTN